MHEKTQAKVDCLGNKAPERNSLGGPELCMRSTAKCWTNTKWGVALVHEVWLAHECRLKGEEVLNEHCLHKIKVSQHNVPALTAAPIIFLKTRFDLLSPGSVFFFHFYLKKNHVYV